MTVADVRMEYDIRTRCVVITTVVDIDDSDGERFRRDLALMIERGNWDLAFQVLSGRVVTHGTGERQSPRERLAGNLNVRPTTLDQTRSNDPLYVFFGTPNARPSAEVPTIQEWRRIANGAGLTTVEPGQHIDASMMMVIVHESNTVPTAETREFIQQALGAGSTGISYRDFCLLPGVAEAYRREMDTDDNPVDILLGPGQVEAPRSTGRRLLEL